MIVGVLLLVTLSVLDIPVSDTADKSGVDGALGGVLSLAVVILVNTTESKSITIPVGSEDVMVIFETP